MNGPSRIESWIGDDGAFNARVRICEADMHAMAPETYDLFLGRLDALRMLFATVSPAEPVDGTAREVDQKELTR